MAPPFFNSRTSPVAKNEHFSIADVRSWSWPLHYPRKESYSPLRISPRTSPPGSPSRSPASATTCLRGTYRPIYTLHILLLLGILLEIYQIYQTPTQLATTVNVEGSSGFGFFAWGLRQSYDNCLALITKQSEDSQQDGNEAERPFNDDPNDPFNDIPFQPSKYNYSLPAEKTKWTLPTQPKPRDDSNIAVIVLSARSNFERRQAIRETWAKEHSNVFFIIGGPEPENEEDKDLSKLNSTTNRLFAEQGMHGDLLDTVHPDSYRGLPYKLHFAIQWISQHPSMKHIEWVVKVDDDSVVRIDTLQYNLLRNYNAYSPMVIGRMAPLTHAHRTGKWAEDPKWVGTDGGIDEYPYWAYGSTGYVISRQVIDYLGSIDNESMYYYQGEDAGLGIWLYESSLDVVWISSPDFTWETNLDADHRSSVIIGHDMTPEMMHAFVAKWDDRQALREALHPSNVKAKGVLLNTERQVEPLPPDEPPTTENEPTPAEATQ